jgi:glucuronate isomerase
MSLELRRRIFDELNSLVLIDPHTHINPLAPASTNLADILGYHYYTELAHSAGLPKDRIEELGLPDRDKVARLMQNAGPITNTVQYSWFVDIAQNLLGFDGDTVTADNWETVYDLAEQKMAQPDWATQVLEKSKLEAVFLTNDFDDPLEGFDTKTYIPCLRTDDLVFHLPKKQTQERLEAATGVTLTDARSLRRAIEQLFRKFKAKGARACAISLPPDFAPAKVSLNRANVALEAVLRNGVESFESHRRALSNFVFWTLAEFCDYYRLPFDLMIGVNRNVYEAGVHQGRDLYDSRVSLVQYKDLFNAFPGVKFPVSVLASVTNQELVSYAWIFPNVVTHGHWWYSNTPAFIERDMLARLEAVPRNKQIGYYSDMYKLEFALPKFGMYKKLLAKVLANEFVLERGWSEAQAVELGKQTLRGNVEEVFRFAENPADWIPEEMELAPPPEYVAPKQFFEGLEPVGATNEFGLTPSMGESAKVLGSRAMQDSTSPDYVPGSLATGLGSAAIAGISAPTFGTVSSGSPSMGIAPGEMVITPPTDDADEFSFQTTDQMGALPASAGAAGEPTIQPPADMEALAPLEGLEPLDVEEQPLAAEMQPLEELSLDELGLEEPAGSEPVGQTVPFASPFAPTEATLVPPAAMEEPPAAWPIPVEAAEAELAPTEAPEAELAEMAMEPWSPPGGEGTAEAANLQADAFAWAAEPAGGESTEFAEMAEDAADLDLSDLGEQPPESGSGGIGIAPPAEEAEPIVALEDLGDEELKLDDLGMQELETVEAPADEGVQLDLADIAIEPPAPNDPEAPLLMPEPADKDQKSGEMNWDFLK